MKNLCKRIEECKNKSTNFVVSDKCLDNKYPCGMKRFEDKYGENWKQVYFGEQSYVPSLIFNDDVSYGGRDNGN